MTTLTQGPYSVRYKESWLQHKGEEGSGIEEKNNLVNLWKKKQLMNDLPVTVDICYAHRILGSPGGKYRKSVKDDRNVRGTQRLFSVKYLFGEGNIA